MIKITDLKPFKKFGPGYFIQEQMDIREWTQADIAEILGVSLKHVNKILNDKQPITLEMAKVLGEVFDTDPKYWINLDTDYRLWLDEERSEKIREVDIKAQIFEYMPIKDMVKKMLIPQYKNTKELEEIVTEFWGMKQLNLKEIDKLRDLCLTRKSEAYNQFNENYKLTWYQTAKNIAEKVTPPSYDKKALKGLYKDIHKYTIQKNGISKFLKSLYEAGVIFFVLPHLQKTYLDGAAFLLNNCTPTVIYTGRYKRIDNFWFTMAHEIAHVLRHLKKEGQYILDNLKEKSEDVKPLEEEANLLASEKLRYDDILKCLSDHLNYLTTDKVEECSEELEVHPSIIIGMLAHENKISYRNIHLYNENVLELIPNKYMWNKINK